MAWILFVDDDPYTLEIYKKAVELFGHHAVVAGMGEDALKLAQEHKPDIIFLDMNMPDMNGFELLERLQKLDATARIPAVMLTASNQFENEDLAEQAGAVAFVQKPIRIDELKNLIEKYASSGTSGVQLA